MKLTILGKYGPYPQDSNSACSGYLVEHENVKILVDCGSGVIGKRTLDILGYGNRTVAVSYTIGIGEFLRRGYLVGIGVVVVQSTGYTGLVLNLADGGYGGFFRETIVTGRNHNGLVVLTVVVLEYYDHGGIICQVQGVEFEVIIAVGRNLYRTAHSFVSLVVSGLECSGGNGIIRIAVVIIDGPGQAGSILMKI